jgi:1-phosphofructokinase
MKFLTLTPNPSLDWTLAVPSLPHGGIVKASAESLHCGGKGINVSRILRRLGFHTIAFFPFGGYSGEELLELVRHEGISFHGHQIKGGTRRNMVLLAGGAGEALKVNTAGPFLDDEEWQTLLEMAFDLCDEGDWMVAGGSLPPGVDERFYRYLAARIREKGASMALDTSGLPLEAALHKEGALRPQVVKMNLAELSELWKAPLSSLEEAWCQGYRFPEGPEFLVSQGSEGAMVISCRGRWHGKPGKSVPRMVVGAGDSLLAGYLAKRSSGHPEGESLRFALACATATAMAPLHELASPEEVEGMVAQIEVVNL